MAILISGKEISAAIRAELKEETAAFVAEKGVTPGLAVIIVGEDPASQVYVRNKHKACLEVGYHSEVFELPAETTQEELLKLIDSLNKNDEVNGILCQLPLPKHIDENAVICAISPQKDVDCFHPVNVGKLSIGSGVFMPCTPMGIMKMLEYEGIETAGKHCVIIGRSNIVGKPMAMLMLAADATVTVCHSKTKNLAEITRQADILVAAVGKPKFVTADMVGEGAVVIDVGMDRDENGKLCGDVDYADVEPKASFITPVPGGVGPMTITMLMRNTIAAAKEQNNIEK